MKVFLNQSGPLAGLVRHLSHEGDEVVPEAEKAELCIPDPMELPAALLEGLGSDFDPSLQPTHVVTRWFDGQSFGPQTFVGIPLLRLWNNDLGPPVPCGIAGRFRAPNSEPIFVPPDIVLQYLKESRFTGFVSTKASGKSTLSMQTGVPYFGLYALLEQINSKISSFFLESGRLYESWCCALLVTRYPFPFAHFAPRTALEGLTPELEKHFWTFGATQFRKTLVTEGTVLGVATAWDKTHNLYQAVQLAQNTARKIACSDIQFRTDMTECVRKQWEQLVQSGVL
jgi:hypothetical protein